MYIIQYNTKTGRKNIPLKNFSYFAITVENGRCKKTCPVSITSIIIISFVRGSGGTIGRGKRYVVFGREWFELDRHHTRLYDYVSMVHDI